MIFARSEALCPSASFLGVYRLLQALRERVSDDILSDPALDPEQRARYEALERRLRRTVAAAEGVTSFSAVTDCRRCIADVLDRFLFVA